MLRVPIIRRNNNLLVILLLPGIPKLRVLGNPRVSLP